VTQENPSNAPDGTVLDYSPPPPDESIIWVDLYHPITKGTHRTTMEAFETVWVHKGWELKGEGMKVPEVRDGVPPTSPSADDTKPGGKPGKE
jgi:hypothetical protein